MDKETGLVWARDANIGGLAPPRTWQIAVSIRSLTIGNRKGWRLPMVEELASLIDPSQREPALPPGYSSFFTDVQSSSSYWTSTTSVLNNEEYAWSVWMLNGEVGFKPKTGERYIWPVRGGSGPILVPHTPTPLLP